ncbi:b(0,+)-type amino acid transporter 1 [Desmophyllum pertusum]|uniref:B(0,+)-type amino acid transporter 1 n=1 Tax=Desmophyllum pertusum TaxID=174260 RepID=A0A9X0CET5_9CNID|nr:b(0,+)-type amino acid transporter 1 [Desmophyllum pertusum]
MLIPETSSFESLLNYFGFFTWFGYLLSISSILWLRYKRPDATRPYKVWLPIPIIMVVVAVYLVFAPFYEAPLQSFYCVLFVSAGIPFYWCLYDIRWPPQSLLRFVDRVTFKLQIICDVDFPKNEQDATVDAQTNPGFETVF